jgi:hypothetical protein
MKVRDLLIQKGGFKPMCKFDRYAYSGASENAVIRHGNYIDYVWSEDIVPNNSVQGIFNFRCGKEIAQCYFFIKAAVFVDWDAFTKYVDDTVYEGLKNSSTVAEVEAYVKGVLNCLGYKLNL